MDHYISMYIDNELSLDEKILFVEHVSANEPYKQDTVALLQQEKSLQASLIQKAPEINFNTSQSKIVPFSGRYLGWLVAACLVILFSFSLKDDFKPQVSSQQVMPHAKIPHRFLIHHSDTRQVEITGSFTNWQRVPLTPTGTNGYWELRLKLPPGEHRYSFIINGSDIIPDPTIQTRETDDFGSTNSILRVEA